MQRRIGTCFFLFLFVCETSLGASHYFQKLSKYTTEHGILNNTILSIFQDSTGRMWFGSLEGLNSYNGKEFLCHPVSDSLSGYQVYFIDQLSEDQLVLGASNSNYLYSISNGSYHKINLQNDSTRITALIKRGGKTYFTTTSGIYDYDEKKKEGTKLFKHSILCKQASPKGRIWLGSVSKGVLEVEFKGDSLLFLKQVIKQLQKEKVKSIQYVDDEEITILTNKGIYLYNNDDLISVLKGSFSDICISQLGEILLGTYGNFLQQLYKTEDHYALKNYINRENGIFNDYYDAQINALYKDHSGSIWIGTIRAGLDRIDRKKITYQKYKSSNQEVEAGYINALFRNKNGDVWVGTSGKGMYFLDKNTGKLISTPIFQGNLNDLYVEAILQHKNKLYVGTRYMGIITAEVVGKNNTKLEATGQLFSKELNLAKNEKIYALKKFKEKLHICSSKGTFIYDLEKKDFSRLDSIQSINVLLDSLNNQWVLSYGLQLYFNQKKLDLGAEVSDFHLNSNGGIWVATSKGVAFLQSEHVKPEFYNPAGKVIEFTSLNEDGEGCFWLGSRMGIYRFDPKTKLFSSYQIAGGSKANSFNHAKLLQSPEGEFYWGSNDGVVSIKPHKGNYLPMPLYEVQPEIKEDAYVFKVFNYSFNHQEENGIAYRFSHSDSTWNYLPADHSVLDFSHLNKGSYEVHISAINADGIINQNAQSFQFQIENSWNTSSILILFSFLLILIFLYWYQKNKKALNTPENEEGYLPEIPEDKLYIEWLKDSFMQNAISIIEEKLVDNTFGVNELYLATQMSKSNFYRKLKKFTNLSPNELIRFVRLRKSAHLLIEAKQSVNEIAYEIGFNSPSYFTRCFKQQFGVAPSEYKEQLTNKE